MKKTILYIFSALATMQIMAQKNKNTLLLPAAVVQYSNVLQHMPEAIMADSILKDLTTQYQALIKEKYLFYKSKADLFDSTYKKMPPEVKAEMSRELSYLEMELKRMPAHADSMIQKRKEELVVPIIDKLNHTIEAYAKEKGYSQVWDKYTQGLLFSEDKVDITEEIKKRLKA